MSQSRRTVLISTEFCLTDFNKLALFPFLASWVQYTTHTTLQAGIKGHQSRTKQTDMLKTLLVALTSVASA